MDEALQRELDRRDLRATRAEVNRLVERVRELEADLIHAHDCTGYIGATWPTISRPGRATTQT